MDKNMEDTKYTADGRHAAYTKAALLHSRRRRRRERDGAGPA